MAIATYRCSKCREYFSKDEIVWYDGKVHCKNCFQKIKQLKKESKT